MEIKIIEVISEHEVVVANKYGKMNAEWIGESPKKDSIKNVEVETNDTLVWGQDIVETNDKNYKIESIDGRICLQGFLESISEDGYTVIRLGESIICVDTEGMPLLEIGDFVTIKATHIELHDSRL